MSSRRLKSRTSSCRPGCRNYNRPRLAEILHDGGIFELRCAAQRVARDGPERSLRSGTRSCNRHRRRCKCATDDPARHRRTRGIPRHLLPTPAPSWQARADAGAIAKRRIRQGLRAYVGDAVQRAMVLIEDGEPFEATERVPAIRGRRSYRHGSCGASGRSRAARQTRQDRRETLAARAHSDPHRQKPSPRLLRAYPCRDGPFRAFRLCAAGGAAVLPEPGAASAAWLRAILCRSHRRSILPCRDPSESGTGKNWPRLSTTWFCPRRHAVAR